ncbi:hypothetical protein MRB53_040983 [Persea americana]|nr:hypothetical protein MRB53_040983 [Persea americana]
MIAFRDSNGQLLDVLSTLDCPCLEEAKHSHDSTRICHHFGVWIRVNPRDGRIASCTIPQSPSGSLNATMAVQTPARRSLLEYGLLAIPLYFFIIGPLLSSWFPDGVLGSVAISDKSDTARLTNTAKPGRDFTKNYAAEHAQDETDNHHAIQLDNLVLPRSDEDMAAICERPGDLMVRVLSREPLVLYIENFLTTSEIDSIISTGSPLPPSFDNNFRRRPDLDS